MKLFRQKGAALIVFAVILVLAATAFLVSQLDASAVKIMRDKKTAAALATAKKALIARAVTDMSMPGSLPCPSTSVTYDGIADFFSTTDCPSYIGWFPWKTLSTDDLRDGNSERLWYALSPAYRDHPVIQPLNSDTAGTLTVDGTGDIVAIIFATGSSISQSRPSNNVTDYLEGTNNNGDATYSAMLSLAQNDKLITISRDEIMRTVEKRVAGEVLSCFRSYNQNSTVGQGDGNLDRHPWSTNGAGAYPSFADSTDHRFGRVPDNFNNTRVDSSNIMSSSWATTPSLCKPITDGWWASWKELVFYAVAWDKDPSTSPSPLCNNDVLNDCLTIVTPSASLNHKKVAVIVAGKAIGGQLRGTTAQKQTLSNYLEGNNVTSTAGTRNPQTPTGEDAFFEQKPVTAIFNDVVVFY